MISHVDEEKFQRDLLNAQRGLYAFIVRLIPNAEDAHDVLQETNLVLLRKQKEFRVGESFNAWAAGIARYQVLAFRRDAGRERLVFSDPLLDQLAARGLPATDRIDFLYEAMELCRKKLSEADRLLLDYRYSDGLSVAEIATSVSRTSRAVSQSLYRIRITLLECIKRTASSLERANVR